MICRGGSGSGAGGSNAGKEKVFTTLVFTDNEMWTVPDGIINNEVNVRIFGGGGGGGLYSGGGSGWMNNDIIKVSPGEIINITIGKGGVGQNKTAANSTISESYNSSKSGGATSFGGYLVANGGDGGNNHWGGNGGAGGGGRSTGGKGYQFGGGGSINFGGNGGVWGGGGGGWLGGSGGIYGGAGGGTAMNVNKTWGGSFGGKYGGGAAACIQSNTYDYAINNVLPEFRANGLNFALGGEYGGNGSISFYYNDRWHGQISLFENGTNTLGLDNVFNDGNCTFNGEGIGGFDTYNNCITNVTYLNSLVGSGGGYGGNGGPGASGGGGYGSNGGVIYNGYRGNKYDSLVSYHYSFQTGGGGGGYGGDGGSSAFDSYNGVGSGGGGGGGYGKIANGGNSPRNVQPNHTYAPGGSGGGGGYYCPGKSYGTAVDYRSSFYSYGGGGTIYEGREFASGGNSSNGHMFNEATHARYAETGLNGLCILQFYRYL